MNFEAWSIQKSLVFVGLCFLALGISTLVDTAVTWSMGSAAFKVHCGYYPMETPPILKVWNESSQQWESNPVWPLVSNSTTTC
jgi:hypothetical protein